MKRVLIIGGSILLIMVFIVIMGSGFILKKPLTEGDDVLGQVNLVKEFVLIEDWDKANQELDNGFLAWEKIKNRIQYSVERTFIEDIDSELATLKGSIVAKDKQVSVITVERIKILWKELGK